MPLRRSFIIAFCLFHMFAVAVFGMPRAAQDPLSKATRAILLPVINFYVLPLSQWQQWDMFSPDPLRNVSEYPVETQENGLWTVHTTLQKDTYPFWRWATHYKVFENLLERGGERQKPLIEHFVHTHCRLLGIAPGTPVRLLRRFSVLPLLTDPLAIHTLPTELTDWQTDIILTASCPASS